MKKWSLFTLLFRPIRKICCIGAFCFMGKFMRHGVVAFIAPTSLQLTVRAGKYGLDEKITLLSFPLAHLLIFLAAPKKGHINWTWDHINF